MENEFNEADFEIISGNTDEIVSPPANPKLDEFLSFMSTPTTHDGKEANELNDFEDILPGQQKEPTPQQQNTSGTPPQQNNLPQQPANRPRIDLGAKAVMKGIDFVHGIAISFIVDLTPEEEEKRKYRTTDRELNEMVELLSDIFIEENIKISPKMVFFFLMLTVYVGRTTEAVRSRKRKKKALTTIPGEQPAKMEIIEKKAVSGKPRGKYKPRKK